LKESKSFWVNEISDVNLDKIDGSGSSPLFLAIVNGHEIIAFLLNAKGARVEATPEKLAKFLCM